MPKLDDVARARKFLSQIAEFSESKSGENLCQRFGIGRRRPHEEIYVSGKTRMPVKPDRVPADDEVFNPVGVQQRDKLAPVVGNLHSCPSIGPPVPERCPGALAG